MTVTIGPAEKTDAPALLPLLLAQYDEHAIVVLPERLAQAVSEALDAPERARFLVARHPSAGVVGLAYVSFAWPLEIADKTMWLEELFVVPEFRSQKLGEKLLLAVLELAEQSACRTVDLEVEESHGRVTAFYTRHGFRPHRRTHFTRHLRP
jgi:GNAT superfamily N-acetyltransferase